MSTNVCFVGQAMAQGHNTNVGQGYTLSGNGKV